MGSEPRAVEVLMCANLLQNFAALSHRPSPARPLSLARQKIILPLSHQPSQLSSQATNQYPPPANMLNHCFKLAGLALAFLTRSSVGQVELPDLPYAQDALEPYISAEVGL